MSFVNRVGFITSTTGTGSVNVVTSLPGYATPAESGAVNGGLYSYAIEEGEDFEVGIGTYSSAGPTFSRDTVYLSKIGGTPGTTKITLSGTATVRLTVAAEDLLSPQATLKGRLAGTGTGAPANLNVSQILGLLGAFSGINLQAFTANGTYTPTAGMRFCIAIGTGGGGGGGGARGLDSSSANAGSGGSGGATVINMFTAAEIGVSRAVTIGAAGTAGADTGANGGAGGNTVLDGLLTANGGVGGIGANQGSPDHRTDGTTGATASGGILNIHGGNGGRGAADANSFLFGGDGGGSFWGSGGPGTSSDFGSDNSALPGSDGRAFGTGGSGATCEDNTSGAAGGAGAAGVLFIIEFL